MHRFGRRHVSREEYDARRRVYHDSKRMIEARSLAALCTLRACC